MSKLRDLQCAIAQGVLGRDEPSILDAIFGGALDPAARLQIYRHHFQSSLTEALKAIYPVVCRLVDERFFAFAADHYIESSPPRQACLFEYGESFPDFLGTFPPCRSLTYLPDVARLEYHINSALHAPAETPIEAKHFAGIPVADYPHLVFRLQPSVRFIASPWPIDLIWRASQPHVDQTEVVDLNSGGCRLEIRQWDDGVVFRGLDPAEFDFRVALGEGRPLEAAIGAALDRDRLFDATVALSRLFSEGLIAGFSLLPPGSIPES
jgi:hypothetical protein